MDSLSTPERLLRLATGGYVVANAIFAAARLDVASALVEGPKSSEDIASKLGLDAFALRRLLRALATAGVFEQLSDGRFALTPLSQLLVDDGPRSMRTLLSGGNAKWHHALWGELTELVRTGQPIAPRILGQSVYEYLEAHPEDGADFNKAKIGFSERLTRAVLDVYDFSSFSSTSTVVDIGAGLGHFLDALLVRAPAARGILFDLPKATEQAAARLENSALRPRIEIVAGDFFKDVPAGGDAYVLMNILHNWDDDSCVRILQSCRRVMKPGVPLLVIEMILPEIANDHFGLLLDVEMMVLFGGGRERTAAEFGSLYEKAGFRLSRILPTGASSSIIEGCVA